MVKVRDRCGITVRVLRLWAMFRSEICNLRTCDFEIARRILQIDKSRATLASCLHVVLF